MKSALAALVLLSSFEAHAVCYGTGSLRTCTDDNGNTYTLNQSGYSTFAQGSNPQTGNNWNSNTYRSGSSTNTSGTDSSGRAFNRTCNQFGCYQ